MNIENFRFDELEINTVFFSPTRTISEADLLMFAGLTGDFNELHTSITFADKTTFKKRIAHGMLILSLANGLYMRCGVFNSSVFLSVENWKAIKPVFIGDTIQLRLTITGKRRTKDGTRAIIDMLYEVINQENQVVAEGLFHRMINVST